MKGSKTDIYLPTDVVTEILLRLPAKSLGRCKSVCRTWNNLIRNPSFIKNHYHHPRNPTRIFVHGYCMRSRRFLIARFTNETISRWEYIQLPVFSPGRSWILFNIEGPVNGLYLVIHLYRDSKVLSQALWNPTTSEFRELPAAMYNDVMYVGFGSTEKDIKVALIKGIDSGNLNVSIDTILTYSLARDCWKKIDLPCNLKKHNVKQMMEGQFMGAFWWRAENDGRDFLLAFDIETEDFREVKLPPECLKFMYTRRTTICVRDNSSIVLFDYHYKEPVDELYDGSDRVQTVDIWEMKKEGEWMKLLSFGSSSSYVNLDPFRQWFMSKDEIVIHTKVDSKDEFVIRSDNTVLYNIGSNKIRNIGIGIDELERHLNYKESLTSVRGGHVV